MKHLQSQTWPRLRDRHHEVACHFCDSLHDVELIEEGQAAFCNTCKCLLYRNQRQSLERAFAFGLTGLLFLAGMILLPFISMDAQGNHLETSAGQTVLRLWLNGGLVISMAQAIFIFILPLIQLSCLIYLCGPLLRGIILPGARNAAKIIQSLQNWVMVEVFFLGTLVSLLKLIKLADITLGLGFWSMIGLMLCLAAGVGGIDKLELWDRMEVAEKQKEPLISEWKEERIVSQRSRTGKGRLSHLRESQPFDRALLHPLWSPSSFT